MILAFAGNAGSGKDTAAAYIRDHYKHVALIAQADPLKAICQLVFDFTDDQLYGNSNLRNRPDSRYPRPGGTHRWPANPPGTVWLPIFEGRGAAQRERVDAHALVDAADFDRASCHRWSLCEKDGHRYARTSIDGVKVYLHRFVTASDAEIVDHRNGDGLDNRRSNLRPCSKADNQRNTKKRSDGVDSPFKGVSRDVHGHWRVACGDRTRGGIADEAEAATIYDAMAREQFGDYARTNASLFLTPRHALQTLGTEWGRACFEDVWIDFALRRADALLAGKPDPIGRVRGARPACVIITDVRFENELVKLQAAGATVVLIDRPGALDALGAAAQHSSETELQRIDRDRFNVVVKNDGTLDEFKQAIDLVARRYGMHIISETPAL